MPQVLGDDQLAVQPHPSIENLRAQCFARDGQKRADMNLQLPGRSMRWIGPVAISVVGLVLIFGNPLSIDAACQNTQNCALSWIGALSGWGAVVAAICTVVYLQRQIADANRHHREMLALALQPKLAIANRARIDSNSARRVAEETVGIVRPLRDLPYGYEGIIESEVAPKLRVLTEVVTSDSFTRFENEIGSPMPFILDEVRQNLAYLNSIFDHGFDPTRFERQGELNMGIAVATLERIILYSGGCSCACTEFQTNWKSLVATEVE